MKNLIITLAVVGTLIVPAFAQPHELVKKWETEPTLKTPESVLFDAGARVLYVSNIDGQQPWAKDGKGSIAKVGLDGKVIAAEWMTGFEAPKGLGLHQGRLYVADIDRVVVVDVAKNSIAETIPVAGAKKLNDITIDAAGVVYVSDSETGKVHAINGGKVSVYLENLKGPNGVLAHGGDFYVLASGTLFKVGQDKSLLKIVDGMEPSTDGIEHVQGDEFVVSSWNGVMYYVKGGEKQQLLDTRPLKKHTADIGYDAKNRMVYVPTFFANTVVAYEVK
ncbi:MAG TPA: ATP/GTP-binding protein [Opitutaceae bacterium]|nr:ATP/GTP-binding protein [Opitutaceae bacterium]